MRKAEERALEAYPVYISEYSDNCHQYDSNESDREVFLEGYEKAIEDVMEYLHKKYNQLSTEHGLTAENLSSILDIIRFMKKNIIS